MHPNNTTENNGHQIQMHALAVEPSDLSSIDAPFVPKETGTSTTVASLEI